MLLLSWILVVSLTSWFCNFSWFLKVISNRAMAEGTVGNPQLPRTRSDGMMLVPVRRVCPSGGGEVNAIAGAPALVTRTFGSGWKGQTRAGPEPAGSWLANRAEPCRAGEIHQGRKNPAVDAQLRGVGQWAAFERVSDQPAGSPRAAIKPSVAAISRFHHLPDWQFSNKADTPSPGYGHQREVGIVSLLQQFEDNVGLHSISKRTPDPWPWHWPRSHRRVDVGELRWSDAVPRRRPGQGRPPGSRAAAPMAAVDAPARKRRVSSGSWRGGAHRRCALGREPVVRYRTPL